MQEKLEKPFNPFFFIHCKIEMCKNEIQCNLDLVTPNLVTNCDLVTILQKTIFSVHKNITFSDNWVSSDTLI